MTTTTEVDLAYVDRLMKAHPELTRTRVEIAVQDGRVSVEVHGSHREARAWRHAIDGRIMPHYVDVRGVRRQLIIGHGMCVEVVEHPPAGGEL